MSKDSTLKGLVNDAISGDLVLPDFQRDFTWKLADIKSLIASIFLKYPIGSILTVEKEKGLFAQRKIQGLECSVEKDQVKYLLDGQQRLTSSYLVFSDSYKNSKVKKSIRRRWFIDLAKLGLQSSENYYEELKQLINKNLKSEISDDIDIDSEVKRILNSKEEGELINILKEYILYDNLDNVRRKINNIFKEETIFKFPEEKELIEILEEEKGAIVYKKVNCSQTSKPIYKDFNDPDFKEFCLSNKYYPLSKEILDGTINYTLIQGIAEHELQRKIVRSGISKNSDSYKQLEIKKDNWVNKAQNFLNAIQQYTLPEIDIEKNASLEKIARVFETVNKSGMTLTLFELLVARAIKPGSPSLKDIIDKVKTEIDNEYIPNSVFTHNNVKFNSKQFYQNKFGQYFYDIYPKILSCIIQLEEHNKKSIDISKQMILSCDREYLNKYAEDAAKRLYRAYIFLNYRCGVTFADKIPYKQMLIPIAMVMNDETWEDSKKINKLEAWYWSAIFSTRYIYFQEKMAKDDSIIIRDFILNETNSKPKYISNISSNFVGFNTLRDIHDKSNGMYKSVLQYILSKESKDLIKDSKNILCSYNPFIEDKLIEDHHIVPKGWISRNLESIDENLINSCLNRVYISFEANRGITDNGIHDKNPIIYLKEIDDGIIEDLAIPLELKKEEFKNITITQEINEVEIIQLKGYDAYIYSRYDLLKQMLTSEIIELL